MHVSQFSPRCLIQSGQLHDWLKDTEAGHQTRTGMILTQPMEMSVNRNISDPTLMCLTASLPYLPYTTKHAPTALRATRKETLGTQKHMMP